MRRLLLVILVFLAVVWIGLTNVGSSLALSDIAARPILALVKHGQRIPVQQSGQTVTPEMARDGGGEGAIFGYQFRLLLPVGEAVLCKIRFRTVTCDNGWTADRTD